MRRKTHVDAPVQLLDAARDQAREPMRAPFRGPETDTPWRRAEDIPPGRESTPHFGRLCVKADVKPGKTTAAPGPAAGPSYHREDDCGRASQRPADDVDEASMESFPCSDAPAICRDSAYITAWEAQQMGL